MEDSSRTPNDSPESLNMLLQGMDLPVSKPGYLNDPPLWLDVDKFARGKKFAMEYFACIAYAEMLSLILLFTSKPAIDPLIFTGKSDTPYKAFKRYLSTVTRVKTWYTGDIWNPGDEARKNIEKVWRMHYNVEQRMQKASPDELQKKTSLSSQPTWSSLTECVRESAKFSCLETVPCTRRKVFVSQTEMSVTQFGFVGLLVCFPSKFGVGAACKEDLEAFVHLWRGIGYLLGIEDRFNFCSGDLENVRQRSMDVIEYWLKPGFREASVEWEHMSRCAIEGVRMYVPSPPFEFSFLYLCDAINLPMPHLWQQFTMSRKSKFLMMSAWMRVVLRLCPWLQPVINRRLLLLIEAANNAPPDWLHRREHWVYGYQIDQPSVLQEDQQI